MATIIEQYQELLETLIIKKECMVSDEYISSLPCDVETLNNKLGKETTVNDFSGLIDELSTKLKNVDYDYNQKEIDSINGWLKILNNHQRRVITELIKNPNGKPTGDDRPDMLERAMFAGMVTANASKRLKGDELKEYKKIMVTQIMGEKYADIV